MRSAWSPTRSMSFDTVFDVCPSCLLALPTVLTTDLTSSSGSFTPSTFGRRDERRLRIKPPATPAAAAPAATAGPLALLAAVLTVPTTPLLLLALAELRLPPPRLEREEPPLERDEPLLERDAALPERDEPLLERELLLRARVAGDDFERAEPPLFAFDPELLEERLLAGPLREVDLLVAIRDTSSNRETLRHDPRYPFGTRITQMCRGLRRA